MARGIEKGATYLDKLCHKLYDEPKGRGVQVDGKCRRCGGPLMTYYCEDRLYLIACEKCGALALTKSASPQVAANLTLRKPTLTPPNDPLTIKQLQKMVGEPVYDYLGQEWYVIQEYYDHELTMTDGTRFFDDDEIDGVDKRFSHRPPEGEEDT